MCTTYLATELIREFAEYDLIGNPRLVRLNPNVPWKTRGNGAVSLVFGKGVGKKKKIGQLDGKDLFAYHYGEHLEVGVGDFEKACGVVKRLAMFDDENTNPGIVFYDKKPSPAIYWQAVRGLVTLDGLNFLTEPVFKRGYKNGRGLIGATAAISWRPNDRTHELIAYRHGNMWGKPREIDEASVIDMDKKYYSTFNNYDYEENHVVIAPSSPCPVLFGIRGDSEPDLPKAMEIIKGEKAERWVVFLTNQGTDDHIRDSNIGSLESYSSARISGVVSRNPEMLEGGHLVFAISRAGRQVDCTIYEPAKKFREVGAKLMVGDMITVTGGVREEPFTINVEKLKIEKLADYMKKVSNPKCGKCGKSMKSVGRGQGYRCAVCGVRAGENDARFEEAKRELAPGWYEPPVSALRHLSKPLKRMGITGTRRS